MIADLTCLHGNAPRACPRCGPVIEKRDARGFVDRIAEQLHATALSKGADLKPWADLDDDGKQNARRTALVTLRAIEALGLRIVEAQ